VRESKQEELFFFLWGGGLLWILAFCDFSFFERDKTPTEHNTHRRERNEPRERKNIDTRTCSDKTARDSFVDRKRKHTHTTHASE
jgi:hypothetical protein